MKTRLPQENIPWQPVLSYKKMQAVNFYSWKKGCISKFKQKRDGRMMNLKGRNFLKLMDYTPEEILCLIDLAADLKKNEKRRHLT